MNNQIPPNSYFSELRFRFPVYHFFYLSNALSILRILLVPAIYWSLISEHMVVLICVGGVAFISDMLDGYFARRLDQKSELGKVLDPIADKLTISLVSFALILSRKPEFDANFPVWAFLIMIMRDLLILTGSAFLFKRTQVIEPSNIWGRVATVFISIALILYILNYQQIFYELKFRGTFIDYINFIKDLQIADRSLSTDNVLITKQDDGTINVTSTLIVNLMKI